MLNIKHSLLLKDVEFSKITCCKQKRLRVWESEMKTTFWYILSIYFIIHLLDIRIR